MESKGEDILRIKKFFLNWNSYDCNVHSYNTLFIKYESLNKNYIQNTLFRFIDPKFKNAKYVDFLPKKKIIE